MEPDVSIEGARMIRVAVVGVGNIPTAQLRDYVSLIVRHKRVQLKSASSFYKEHQKSPFMREPWDIGSLCFKFLVGGAPKSPWEDFQANRKCLGVIGLLHCPSSSDLGAAYDHFMAICRAYPSAQEKRCFAFYPRGDQVTCRSVLTSYSRTRRSQICSIGHSFDRPSASFLIVRSSRQHV